MASTFILKEYQATCWVPKLKKNFYMKLYGDSLEVAVNMFSSDYMELISVKYLRDINDSSCFELL